MSRISLQAVWMLSCLLLVAVIVALVHYAKNPVLPGPRLASISGTPVSRLEYGGTQSGNQSAMESKPQFTSNGEGFVLALHFSDQMTGATVNLGSLQCWAASLGPRVRVVEPFVRRSVLGVDDQHRVNTTAIPKKSMKKSVKLFDVFDKAHYNSYAKKYKPLVSWEYFMKNRPRRLIFVGQECAPGKCMECKDSRTKDLLRSIDGLTSMYDFELVRKVCYPRKTMSSGKFKELIYQDYAPNEVVLVFNYWGGIDRDTVWRIDISDMRRSCKRTDFFHSFPLSSKLKHDGQKYYDMYLKSSNYISVMVRLEQFYERHHFFKGMTDATILALLEKFYQSIVEKVNSYKTKYNIKSVFLTLDCRKQGSGTFAVKDGRAAIMKLMSDSITSLYTKLYGNSSTLEEWDESFAKTSSYSTEGYLAMLQKHLAANGTCLITAGGGSFQQTTRTIYQQYHHGSNKCVQSL